MAEEQRRLQSRSPSRTPSRMPSTINLHFLSPSTQEVPNGRLALSNVPLDIEVGALQQRIAEQLQHPTPPDRLRLIYYGRAMTDMKARLRTYLQRELDLPSAPETITIHLVITPSYNHPGNGTARGLPNPPTIQAQSHLPTSMFGQPPPDGTHRSPTPQLHPGNAVHTHAQAPLFNSAHMNLHQQAVQGQLQTIQHQIQQMANYQGIALPNFPFPPGLPGMPHQPVVNWQNLGAQQQQQPAGNSHQTAQDPGDSRLSAPYQSQVPHSQTNVQEIVGPNGQRMRVTTHVESMIISRPGTSQHATTNGQTPGQSESTRPENRSTAPLQSASATPLFHSNAGGPVSRSGFALSPPPQIMPFFQPSRPAVSPAVPSNTTTAWLVSSPAGPQAILFSPEHGLFTSRPTPTPTQPQARHLHAESATQHAADGLRRLRERVQQAQQEPQAARDQAGEPGPPDAPVIIRRRADAQQNPDLIALFFSRIWLFIRLYLFALMFTDAGSWLRYAILTGAVIYCLQPPNNFLQEQFRRLQGHLDGLVPLAPPADRQNPRQGQGQQPNQINPPQPGASENSSERPATRRNQREPTPQEAAQRLLQQHNERNRSWWMETGRRIERSVALFLASLVPGVGERHIRARNEAEIAARAAAEREERERREQAAGAQTEGEGSSAGAAATASGNREGGSNGVHGQRPNEAQGNVAPPPIPA